VALYNLKKINNYKCVALPKHKKANRGIDVQLHAFLTSALHGAER
jgi:hypothetical protein